MDSLPLLPLIPSLAVCADGRQGVRRSRRETAARAAGFPVRLAAGGLICWALGVGLAVCVSLSLPLCFSPCVWVCWPSLSSAGRECGQVLSVQAMRVLSVKMHKVTFKKAAH